MMDIDGVCTDHEVSIVCTSCMENERERIVEIILQSELGDYDAGFIIDQIRGVK